MTHTVAYTVANAETAERIAAATNVKESALPNRAPSGNFNGRRVERTSETTFELYASNSDHAEFERLVRENTVEGATEAEEEQPATEKQLSYLAALVQRDPGAAMTVGASHDGANVPANLSKRQASKMIDLMLSGV